MAFVIPFFIPHRGCPHQCLFCNQKQITGVEDDERAPLDIVQKIDATIEEWLTYRHERVETQFGFYGGSFTCMDHDLQCEMLEAVGPWIESGEIDSIRLSTRPDCVTPEICRNLTRHNVTVVELGAQSMDDSVLSLSRRGHTEDDISRAAEILGSASIKCGIQLMPGLPGESRHSFMATVRKVIALKPDFVRIYPALVVLHSGMAELYSRGAYTPLTLEKAVVLTCWAKRKFESASIGVVRMGLQPSESLEKSILAGPYHPAFGELVKSREWLGRVRRCLAGHPGKKIELHISHRDISSFNGERRSNMRRLKELGLADRLEVKADKNMERGKMRYVVC